MEMFKAFIIFICLSTLVINCQNKNFTIDITNLTPVCPTNSSITDILCENNTLEHRFIHPIMEESYSLMVLTDGMFIGLAIGGFIIYYIFFTLIFQVIPSFTYDILVLGTLFGSWILAGLFILFAKKFRDKNRIFAITLFSDVPHIKGRSGAIFVLELLSGLSYLLITSLDINGPNRYWFWLVVLINLILYSLFAFIVLHRIEMTTMVLQRYVISVGLVKTIMTIAIGSIFMGCNTNDCLIIAVIVAFGVALLLTFALIWGCGIRRTDDFDLTRTIVKKFTSNSKKTEKPKTEKSRLRSLELDENEKDIEN